MKCPKCDKEVSPEFNVCPWCGYKPKKCNNPEHQDVWLPAEAHFCPRCGEPLSDEKAGGTETRETETRKTETRKSNDYPNENLEFDVEGVCFNMVFVEGGTFMMGAQSDDEDEENYDPEANSDEGPVHEVTLSDYHIGETLVTQELWEAVMDNNPSEYEGYDCPVVNVSWDDCQAFLKKLNRMLRDQLPRGCKFRLPTEAQWEFAARGGNESEGYPYSGSYDIDDVAWYGNNSDDEIHSVMEKLVNELLLYDMSGNVCEWCQDWYEYYEDEVQNNPKGPKEGSYRVYRGGFWKNCARCCRVVYRRCSAPDLRHIYIGFRLVLQ